MALSVLFTIEADIKKFAEAAGTDAEKFAKAFEKWFGKAPSALQTIENFLGEVAPIVVGATALVDPVAEPEVAIALAGVQTSVAALQAAASAANSGGTLLQDLQNFSTSVPSILGAIKVTNPALQAKVEKIVTLVVSEAKVLIPAVEAWVAQIKASQTKTS